jgi:predicted nucleic acid-binding protein
MESLPSEDTQYYSVYLWDCTLDTSLLVPLLIREPGTPRVQALFDKFRSLRLELVPLEAAVFEAAARLCDASAAPLRVGDALHLAVCRRVRGSLATDEALLPIPV